MNTFNQSKSHFHIILVILFVTFLSSCSEGEPIIDAFTGNGFFIVNEGLFDNGNASLSYFDKGTKTVTNDYFFKTNERNLGDQAQSMTVYDGKGYIVVQNSSKVEVISMLDGKSVATIDEGLPSPRYFLPISNSKAYVSDWGADGKDGTIKVVDLTSNLVTKSVYLGSGTNQMILIGDKVYAAMSGGWGNDNRILIIDANTEKVLKSITVGESPKSMVKDEEDNIWVAGAGYIAYNDDWSIDESKSTKGFIAKINTTSETLELTIEASKVNAGPKSLSIDSEGNNLFFIYDEQVNTMETSVTEDNAQFSTLIDKSFYGLTFDQKSGHIIGLEAPDFTSNGTMYRYTSSGELVDSYEVGIGPNGCGF